MDWWSAAWPSAGLLLAIGLLVGMIRPGAPEPAVTDVLTVPKSTPGVGVPDHPAPGVSHRGRHERRRVGGGGCRAPGRGGRAGRGGDPAVNKVWRDCA